MAIIVSSLVMDFGSITKSKSITKQLIIYNTANVASNISSVTCSSSDYSAGPTVFSIIPNGSFTITVEYTANQLSQASGTITIVSDSGSIIVQVSAEILVPTMTIDTSFINFGIISAADSASFTRTIKNTSTNGAALQLVFQSVNGNFTVNTISATLLAGDSVDVIITFKPSSANIYSGEINITTNDSVGLYSIILTGQALIPTYTLSPSVLNFPSIPIGQMSVIPFTITNTSNVNLIISTVEITDQQISLDKMDTTINAGASQVFNASFVPTSSINLDNSIVLISNVGNIKVTYQATGLIVSAISVNTTLFDLDYYTLNEAQTISLIITNIGLIDLRIDSITFPIIANTTISTSQVFPLFISSNSSSTITISITSTATIDILDVMVINSNSYDQPTTINLQGHARSPELSLSSQNLDFGTIQVGTDKDLALIVTNSGNVDLDVTIINSLHFIANNNNAFTVAAQSSLTINIDFQLATQDTVNEIITINSNDINNLQVNLPVTGTANFDHMFTVIPNVIVNNYIDVGIESQISLTIINSGVYTALIDGFTDTQSQTKAAYAISTNNLPMSLQPGASGTIVVKINATNIGTISGQLKFNTRVGNELQFNTSFIVQYTGKINSPAIILSDVQYNFSDVAIGQIMYKNVTITNESINSNLTANLTTQAPFYFRNSTTQILTAVGTSINVNQTNLVLSTINLVDSITGVHVVFGDPTNTTNTYSVNTSKGIITISNDLQNRSFSVSCDNALQALTVLVADNSNTQFTIGFSPSSTGEVNGSVLIASNDINNQSLPIQLSGNGINAVSSIKLLYQLVNFVAKVNQTISQKAVLKNTGNTQLYITSVDVAAPFTINNNQFLIDPNQTYEMLVTFSPIDGTAISQNIVLHGNVPDLTISITGQGKHPIMSVPTSISFGDVSLNSKKDITYRISNTGIVELNTSLSITTDGFSVSPSVTVVEGSSYYDITVSFLPTILQTYSAQLSIISDDQNTPQLSIPITGNGINKPVIVTPQKLTFSTTVAQTSIQQLTVQNTGSDILNLISANISDDVLSNYSIKFAPIAIAPQGSTSIEVRFTPKLSGENVTATVTITDNDSDKPIVTIKLTGTALQASGQWKDFDLQKMLPPVIKSLAKGVDNVITPLKTILDLIKQVFNVIKILLVDSGSALKPILDMLQTTINDYVNDLTTTGLYMLAIYPSSTYNDYLIQSKHSLGKYLASIGGGSEKFKSRIIDSFGDTFDSKRPQFSDSAMVGAVVIAVDSGNVSDIIKGIMALSKIFTSIKWTPELEPPNDISASSGQSILGDTQVILQWSIANLINFNIGNIYNSIKITDVVDCFDIYRCQSQGAMTIATEDYSQTTSANKSTSQPVYKKGDVINKFTQQPIAPIASVKASNFFQGNVFNSVNWSDPAGKIVNALTYTYQDTQVSYGQNYYYAIRTRSGSDPITGGSLSVEVLGSPVSPVNQSVPYATWNKCIYFGCLRKQSKYKAVVTLDTPTVKLIDVEGYVIQSRDLTIPDASIPNIGKQNINTYDIDPSVLNDNFNLDASSLIIRNVSQAARLLTPQGATEPAIDVTKFINGTNIISWDDDNSSIPANKVAYFDVLNQTKLSLGIDLIVDEFDTIHIVDKTSIGYKSGDVIVIEYNDSNYLPACTNNQFVNRFDATKCAAGTTVCPGMSRKRCVYLNGTTCTNLGNTMTNKNCMRQNAKFAQDDYEGCLDGWYGGDVKLVDKPFINDPNYTIHTTGVCAGYQSIDEGSVGTYPNWTNMSLQGMVKPLEDFITSLSNWVNKELGAIQQGSQSVSQFIDLMSNKITALENFIDQLQQIITVFDEIFSANAGFDILLIPPDAGGITRIKNLVTNAKSGPDSDTTGYTAGVVLLAGGPNVNEIWQFLQLFFGN